ncbi:hypothetical protein ACFFX0_09800 [Citricoccus parietis]|uniref:Uncharacterized protein n=1 Tax=Citricoccus parietis TaxID=592307 RepID=A0ABV5FXQ4_9MICC
MVDGLQDLEVVAAQQARVLRAGGLAAAVPVDVALQSLDVRDRLPGPALPVSGGHQATARSGALSAGTSSGANRALAMAASKTAVKCS